MTIARIKRDSKKVALAQAILEAYQPKSVEDMQEVLKDAFGPMCESMLKGEIEMVHSSLLSCQKGKKMYQQ